MSENEIREPIQKRSIEKKEKIIKVGFDLICKKGYYNINTAEIAKVAGVSTGIIYQYFKDKHDILIAGIKKYASDIFYSMINTLNNNITLNQNNIEDVLRDIIDCFIENHKLSQCAHQELMAMIHSDEEVALFFQKYEIYMTNMLSDILIQNGFDRKNILEKVHIAIHLMDDLCHEIVYHNHKSLNDEVMINFVITCIIDLIQSK